MLFNYTLIHHSIYLNNKENLNNNNDILNNIFEKTKICTKMFFFKLNKLNFKFLKKKNLLLN